jgi:hypothetical protein
MATNDPQLPIACVLTAFTPEERARHDVLLRRLGERVLEVRELPDGYAYRLAPEARAIAELAEWIGLERACCPFLRFTIEVEPAGGPAWLRLTGGSGVKEFVAATFETRPR